MEANEGTGNLNFHSLHANMYRIDEQESFEQDDEEDEEELRQRNAELRNLLDNGFDDLLENSDVEEGVNKSAISNASSRYQIPHKNNESNLTPAKSIRPEVDDTPYLSSGLNSASELEILYNARGKELLISQTALQQAKQGIRALQHQVAVLEGRGTQMGLTTNQAEEALVDAKVEIGDLKFRISELEGNLESLEEDKMELRKNLEETYDSVESLRGQLQTLKHSNTAHQVRQKEEQSLEALRGRFQTEVTRLQAEREKLSSALEERDRAYRLLEEKVASLTAGQERSLRAKAEALTELQSALEQHSFHREQRENLQQALNQAAKERDELKRLNLKLQAKNGSQETEPSLLTSTALSDSMQQLGLVQPESGRGLASKLRESQALIKQLRSQVQSLSKELTVKDQRIMDLYRQNAEQDKQARLLKEQVEPLIARYQSLNTSQSEVEKLQKNVQEAYSLVAKYQSQMGQKEVALAQRELQIQQLESKCSKLSSENSEVKSLYVNVCQEKDFMEKRLQSSHLTPVMESKTIQTDFPPQDQPNIADILEQREKEWEQTKSELTKRLNLALRTSVETQGLFLETETPTTPTLLDQSAAQTVALQHTLDVLRAERDSALKECLKIKEAWHKEKKQCRQKSEEEPKILVANSPEADIGTVLTKIRQKFAQEKSELIAHYTKHIVALQAVQSPVSNSSTETATWEPFLQILEPHNPILAKDLRHQFLSLSREYKQLKEKYRHLKVQIRDYRSQVTTKLGRYKADQREYQAKCQKMIENLLARVQSALNSEKVPLLKEGESPPQFLERLDLLQHQVDTYLTKLQ